MLTTSKYTIILSTLLMLAMATSSIAADVKCPKCGHIFNASDITVTKLSAALAGAAGGAYVGAQIGIVAGPWGSCAGTIPGAIIGGGGAFLGASKFTKCPKCGKIFTK